jgi:hypothetical protein
MPHEGEPGHLHPHHRAQAQAGHHAHRDAATAADASPAIGDNRRDRRTAQWQEPHDPAHPEPAREEDFDLVEHAFCSAALDAEDPTSLLRLARVPFVANLDGGVIRLLAFRIEEEMEVGSLTPGFTSDSPVYLPLPKSRVRRHRRLVFLYDTADGLREFGLEMVRALTDLTIATALPPHDAAAIASSEPAVLEAAPASRRGSED